MRPGCSLRCSLAEKLGENEAGGRVCDVSMAHTLFLQLFIFSSSGWYRLRLFEAQVMYVCVFGVLIIHSHVNPVFEFSVFFQNVLVSWALQV